MTGLARLRILTFTLVGLLAVAGCQVTEDRAESDEPGGLTGRIEALQVSVQDDAGYDRDRFGDYDRDQALTANQDKYPDCDGYYSAADNECHTSADDVQIDHTVALSEAWASGAGTWPQQRLDKFAADPNNLAVMSSELNTSKSDHDPADWLPPHKPHRCDYIGTYVTVKTTYDLAVDRTEKRALLRVARGCASDQT